MLELDRPLRLSRYLVDVPHDGAERAVLHARLHTQLAVSPEAWRLLQRFAQPTPARAVLDALGLTSPAEREAVSAVLAGFVDGGWLTPPDEEEFLFRRGDAIARAQATDLLPTSTGLLGARPGDGPPHVDVVGVPFDRLAIRPGAARAPAALRRLSQGALACIDPATGRHRGVYDHATGQRLMEGASLVDHGDVRFELGESSEDALARVARVARSLAAPDRTAIFIGGDHSITPALFDGVAREPTFVVHFDAHTDLDTVFEGRIHHHGSFMERLRRHPSAAGVLQIGVRDLAPPWFLSPEGCTQLGMERVRRLGVDEVLALVPEHRPCYVSVDIDVLDPSSAPGTGAPVPGGMALPQLEALLVGLATRRSLRALDLVEVSPDADVGGVTQLSALRLLVRTIHALATSTRRC